MKYRLLQQGFTLVELSIVLVIIGLIVSSVLVGQDLIRSAELRATISQYNQFRTAVTTFRGKYSGIPGDLKNADQYGLTGLAAYQDGGVGDGDGNGYITASGVLTTTAFTGEMATFWSHLTTEGSELIPGSYAGTSDTTNGKTVAGLDMPALKFGSNAGWVAFGTSQNVNYLLAGLASDDTNAPNTVNVFKPLDAFGIDDKIDDGVPTTGNVVSRGADSAAPIDLNTAASTATTADATKCDNTGTTPDSYQFTTTTPECTLRFVLTTN